MDDLVRMIRMLTPGGPLAPEEALALPFQPLTRDWHGRLLPYRAEYLLACDPERLHFGFRTDRRLRIDSPGDPGRFQEGLWFTEVAELFLDRADGPAYEEWHVGPCGQWWRARFRDYRERLEEPPPHLDVRTMARPFGAGWEAVASIRISDLLFDPRDEATRGVVTVILAGDPQELLASASASPREPEFHLKAIRLPLERVIWGYTSNG